MKTISKRCITYYRIVVKGVMKSINMIPFWKLFLTLVGFFVVFIISLIAYALVNDISVSTAFLDFVKFLHLGEKSWDWIAVSIAFASLMFAIVTYRSQWKTQENTMKITPESQRSILVDHVRHYYRNLVCICALDALIDGEYDKYYPSQEHILKLTVDISDFHPAAFYNHAQQYQLIHKLTNKIRNFNIEVTVANQHLMSRDVPRDAKERDMATLKYKMGDFVKETLLVLDSIWPDKKADNLSRIRALIDKTAREYNDEILMNQAKDLLKDCQHKYFDNLNTSFTTMIYSDDKDIREFIYLLNCNIYIEMTAKNNVGYDKLFIIPFDKNRT